MDAEKKATPTPATMRRGRRLGSKLPARGAGVNELQDPEEPAREEGGDAHGADPEPPDRLAPPRRLVPLALAFYGAMLGLALGLRGLLTGGSLLFADAAAAERGIAWPADAALGGLAAALVILASRELTRRTRYGAALARSLARALGPLGPGQCLALALASGIGEEALFRGALQPSLGWIGASLLFGLAHLVPRRELLAWSVFALVAGLLLGGLFAWSGNLLAPILAHVLVNAVNLRLLTRESQAPPGARR